MPAVQTELILLLVYVDPSGAKFIKNINSCVSAFSLQFLISIIKIHKSLVSIVKSWQNICSLIL